MQNYNHLDIHWKFQQLCRVWALREIPSSPSLCGCRGWPHMTVPYLLWNAQKREKTSEGAEKLTSGNFPVHILPGQTVPCKYWCLLCGMLHRPTGNSLFDVSSVIRFGEGGKDSATWKRSWKRGWDWGWGLFLEKYFFFRKKKDKTKLNGQTNSSIPEAAF